VGGQCVVRVVIRRSPPRACQPHGKCSGRALPKIDALASLGPLLSLSRSRDTLLTGWRCAVACEYGACVDTNGLRECLRFHSADGECCWQLYALPEDDFLAWERLIATVPEGMACDLSLGLAERVRRRVSDVLVGRRWCANVIRIHAFLGCGWPEQRCLAISQPRVSPFSLTVARHIAQLEGAELPLLDLDVCAGGGARQCPERTSQVRPDLLSPFNAGIPS
jgi:hypothetical protein